MSPKLPLVLLASTALVPAVQAQVLPHGGTVQAGTATIGSGGAGALRIDQASNRAIINWQSFSVGQGGRVDIHQPGSDAALLNRVTGSAGSEIAGQVNANGRVFLVNPNGILITRTGSVKAAGFTASTLDIADKDFMAGSDALTVTAPRGGQSVSYVAGGYAGALSGRRGGLVLATLRDTDAGKALDLGGDGFLQVAVPAGGVTVAGRITANQIVLTAGAARDAARGVVNVSGVLDASSVSARGGTITLTGPVVQLSGATLDASGATGGGSVRVGGDRQGGGSLAHAATTSVDAATVIRVDATGRGDGGSVVVWSDQRTDFAGTISAKGSHGGDAEVSGKQLLSYTGTANLTGSQGFGTLLLDPYNLTISDSGTTNTNHGTATGNDSVINVGDLEQALGLGNVTLSTGASGSAGTQAGNILVAAPVSWGSGSTLSLAAAADIRVDAPVSIAGGGSLNLTYNTNNPQTGGLSFGSGATVTFAAGQSGQTLTINGAAYTLLRSIDDVTAISNGGRYALAGEIDGSARTFNGPVFGATPGGFTGRLQGLGNDFININILDTSTGRAGTGLIGTIGSGGVVSNLAISGSMSGTGAVGALAGVNQGTIYNVSSYAFVTGTGRATGGLVGSNLPYQAPSGDTTQTTGGVIVNSSSDGSVDGAGSTGGLVGSNAGSVSGSWSTATVTGTSAVGGLVGTNAKTVATSHASGDVSGQDQVGGLVGTNTSRVTDGYATGAVTASAATGSAGGVVGRNDGTAQRVHDEGAVSGVVAGGLAGINTGEIDDAYAMGAVTGTGLVGGLTGSNGGAINRAWVSGLVTLTGNAAGAKLGGVTGNGQGTYTAVYWDGDSTGVGYAGSSSSGITRLTTAQARQAASYAGLNGSTWFVQDGIRPLLLNEAATPGIDGIALVSNLHQLQLIGSDAGHYQLTGDIDASATAGTTSGIWGATGFLPNADILGTFDGNNHAIANLSVNNPQASQGGLFYSIGGRGTVRNLAVTNASVAVGSAAGHSEAGILATYNYGTIQNVMVSGSVRTGDNAGAVVGINDGQIRDVSAAGLVVGPGTAIAGLVGANRSGAITNALSTVYTTTPDRSGGNGATQNVLADADVHGGNPTGGNGVSYLSTAQLQSGGTDALGGAWAGGTGGLYPYLQSFYPDGVQAVTGTVSGANGPAAGGQVTLYQNGAVLTGGTGITGANGYYYLAVPSYSYSYRRLTVGATFARTAGGAPTALLYTNATALDSNGNVVLPTIVDGKRVLTGNQNNLFDIVSDATNTVGAAAFAASDTAATSTEITDTARLFQIDQGFSVAGNLLIQATGEVDAFSNALLSGKTVTLVTGQRLVNYAGTGLFGKGTRWLVYSANPAKDQLNGLTPDFYQYAATAGTAPQGKGNGLLYSVAPQLSVSLTGSVEKTYDGTTAASASGIGFGVSGTLPGDTVTVSAPANLSASFTDPDAGAYKNVVASGFSIGQASHNGIPVFGYTLDTTATGQIGIIDPRPITVTAKPATSIYGNDPVLTYTVGGQGLVAGDTLDGALGSDGGATSNVGSYAINQGDLGSDNYAIAFTGATLTITPRPITLRTKSVHRDYGDANPDFTYIVDGMGVVNGDVLDVSFATAANAGSNVGNYAVTPSLAAGGNYVVTGVTSGTLTIDPRRIVVRADTERRTYGDANPALTYTIDGVGLVNGDTLSGTLATVATAQSGVGSYAVTQGTLAASANYVVSFRAGKLVVLQRPITVTANAQSRYVGDANPALTYTVGGSGLVNGDTLSGALATGATAASRAGTYAIARGTLAASGNYQLSYVGANLTVLARPVLVAADAWSRLFGGPVGDATDDGSEGAPIATVRTATAGQ